MFATISRGLLLPGLCWLMGAGASLAAEDDPQQLAQEILATTQTEGVLELSNSQEVLDAWNGKRGGMLWAVSRQDGSKQAAYQLESPRVFDGMAAASGSLYLSTADGRLVCYRGE